MVCCCKSPEQYKPVLFPSDSEYLEQFHSAGMLKFLYEIVDNIPIYHYEIKRIHVDYDEGYQFFDSKVLSFSDAFEFVEAEYQKGVSMLTAGSLFHEDVYIDGNYEIKERQIVVGYQSEPDFSVFSASLSNMQIGHLYGFDMFAILRMDVIKRKLNDKDYVPDKNCSDKGFLNAKI